MHSDRLRDAGIRLCAASGYDVRRPTDGGEPPGVAVPTDTADPPVGDGTRPIGIEPVREPTPTTVLSRVWANRRDGRDTLFVVPDRDTHAELTDLLRPPVGVAAEDAHGCRTFFNGPDRVPLAGGGYAAVEGRPDLTWRETPAESRTGRSGSDDHRLELRADGAMVATFNGTDALGCPPREAVPFRYERGADKLFRVIDATGRVVGTFTGVKALRTRFTPVPMPLVPEHMFDRSIAGHWDVRVASDDHDEPAGRHED